MQTFFPALSSFLKRGTNIQYLMKRKVFQETFSDKYIFLIVTNYNLISYNLQQPSIHKLRPVTFCLLTRLIDRFSIVYNDMCSLIF